ncbi:MAG TPA: hypothetical protein VKT52_05975 [Ktedonobacterales bacterium]|nr:hypothetical protein [Ktedonobacterales bacterium]
MTTVQDCLQEIVSKGPGYMIHSSIVAGADKTSDWEPAVLLADMLRTSPGVLDDHAWTEWIAHPRGTGVCYIHYGILGSSLGHREVPGYGLLRVALKTSPRQESTSTSPGLLTRQLGI